jgi:hypothetical protein
VFDIETSHAVFNLWGTGEQYVRHDQMVHDNYVICWSAKYLFDNKIMNCSVTDKEAKKRDDSRVIKSIHPVLDSAEIVITQNGDWFDIRKLNWKFMQLGLKPNNGYNSIDMLKKSRQVVNTQSHSQQFLAEGLGITGKNEMVNADWLAVEAGDIKAIEKMSKYCDQDVRSLEEIYLTFRPWMKTHPNLAPYMDMYQDLEDDEDMCRRCLSPLHEINFTKRYRSLAGKCYESGNCPHCGSILRRSRSKKGKVKR